MIYTASYFQKPNHHGQLISISMSEPKGVKIDGKLSVFAPNRDLLNDYKKGKIDEQGYIERYREQLRKSLDQIMTWLDGLDPEEDLTLCCWEKAGEFCHRNLVIKFVEKYRPDCLGGTDVKAYESKQQ